MAENFKKARIEEDRFEFKHCVTRFVSYKYVIEKYAYNVSTVLSW